jgi:hypothetical protein
MIIGFVFVACDDGNDVNRFAGTDWTMDSDGSHLVFSNSTWEWTGLEMMSGENLYSYNFEGTYTYSGNTATLISTRYSIPSVTDWVDWSAKWIATLEDDGRLSWTYHGAVE